VLAVRHVFVELVLTGGLLKAKVLVLSMLYPSQQVGGLLGCKMAISSPLEKIRQQS